MFQSVGIVCVVVIIGLFPVECKARHQVKDTSILCYECNSEYDPRCRDPFDPYTIGIVNCSQKRPLDHIKEKPTLCRKTVQKVQGHLRVIRGCGYIPDERDGKECLIRTGTKDVHVRYCSCKGNLCNSGNRHFYPSRIALGAIVLAVTTLVQMA